MTSFYPPTIFHYSTFFCRSYNTTLWFRVGNKNSSLQELPFCSCHRESYEKSPGTNYLIDRKKQLFKKNRSLLGKNRPSEKYVTKTVPEPESLAENTAKKEEPSHSSNNRSGNKRSPRTSKNVPHAKNVPHTRITPQARTSRTSKNIPILTFFHKLKISTQRKSRIFHKIIMKILP